MSVTPYLMVPKATELIAFVQGVFDAEITARVPLESDPERVVHGEARIGDGTLFFGDAGADGCQCRLLPEEPAHLQLWVTVPDPAAAHDRAVAAGATSVIPVSDETGGMGGVIAFGALWWLKSSLP
jgi:PhnB protein